MKAWRLLALVVLVGFSSGCSFDSVGALQTIDNSCGTDVDCLLGRCDGNICIDDSGASADIAIEVLRGATDVEIVTPPSWAFEAEAASGPSSRDLVLPATRQVVGKVRWDGVRVPATLRFVRKMDESVASLVPVPIEVDTLRTTQAGAGTDDDDFSALLVAGATYDLLVQPNSDMVMTQQDPAPAIRTLPPLYLVVPIDEGGPGDPFRLDVSFPAGLTEECTANRDFGCTLHAKVYSAESENQGVLPEAGLQVRAIEEDGRVVSSIAETDEGGYFAIRISNTASKYLIRVTSSAGRAPFPAISVDPDVVFDDGAVEKVIEIPRLTPVQVTGEVRDKIGRTVPVANVRFVSTVIMGGSSLGLEPSFSASAVTNEDGSFGAELLPGFYSVTVSPPEDVENDWGVLSTTAAVGEERTTVDTLIVPSQIGLQGLVSTFSGEPASGVPVLARARLAADPGAVHRSQEAVSSDLGAFAMSIDIGLYDMHVKVPAESGFAWLVEPELLMSLDQGDLRRDYRLEPPIPVYGVVRNSDGVAVPNALVRGYLFDGSDGGDGGAARPLQVAEAVSGEDGSYRLLIAPRLGAE